MLHVFHADELAPLLDSLAARLTQAPADVFAPDVVVVPNAGMKDVVIVGLAERLGASGEGRRDGIAANVDVMFPGRFLPKALGMPARSFLDLDPWQLPHLTWPVLEVLESGVVSGVPRPSGSAEHRWLLARRIADLFDRYASQRATMLSEWSAGRDHDASYSGRESLGGALLTEHAWQPHVWRAVAALIGGPTPSERTAHLAAQVRSGEVVPDLPGRVSLFGFSALAPTLFTVARALGEQIDVAAYVRHHSQEAWRVPVAKVSLLTPRTELDVTKGVEHPLLASWGRPSLEARVVLSGAGDVEMHDVSRPLESLPDDSLLHALQRDVRLARTPVLRPGLSATDGTVQVHACYGDVRQLESLRDALGHAFVADPTLQPHDVLVLCPDITRFAPLVQAVLGRGALPVPVRVGDRAITSDDPMADALQALLALVGGRAALSDVLALVQRAPVRDRLGWSPADVETVSAWASDLGVRWGLEAEHRVAWGLPADLTSGTWRSVLDRLLAGLAMPAPTPRVGAGGTAPYDDLSAADAAAVGSLADLVERLVLLHDLVAQSRPIGEWVTLLQEVLDGFLHASGDDRFLLASLRSQLAEIAAGANDCAIPLSLADVRDLLADVLGGSAGRMSLRSGAVTVSSVIPQAGVPARIVCLVGLDDGAVRTGAFDGDDILGVHPSVGERHPRHESRQLLLDTLLAAGERLIITCNGSDLASNKDIPLTVALAELLDVVNATVVDGKDVVVKHPRHGFNEKALTPGSLSPAVADRFTFDALNLRAAEARRARALLEALDSRVSPWALTPLPPEALASVTVEQLVGAVSTPSRAYLRDRLDVRLPGDEETIDDSIPLTLAALESSALGRELLDLHRKGRSVETWEAATRLSGTMPPGELGALVVTAVSDDVTALVEAVGATGYGLTGAGEAVVEVVLAGGATITGTITDVHDLDGDPTVIDVQYSRARPSHQLGAAVRLAALQLAQPDRTCRAVVGRRGEKEGVIVQVLELKGDRHETARRILEMAAAVWAWTRHDAVPLFDRASRALVTAGDVDKALESDMKDNWIATLWGGYTAGHLSGEPRCVSDPDWLPVGPRALALAQFVWGAYDESVLDAAAADPAPAGADAEGDE